MFEQAQPQIERIVALVALCPEKLQEKCFELLLSAYLETLKPRPPQPASIAPAVTAPNAAQPPSPPAGTATLPEAIKPRLTSLAGRKKVSIEKAANLFDFNADPITYHAYVIPGNKKSEKTRNLALALALKNYVLNGSWVADWKEFRAACVDQNCLDLPNMATIMTHDWFKTVDKSEGITLSSQGTAAAESQFVTMAGGPTD